MSPNTWVDGHAPLSRGLAPAHRGEFAPAPESPRQAGELPHGGGLVTALSPLSKSSGGYAADGCGPVVTGRCDSPGRDDSGGAAYYQTDTDESMAGDDPEGSARSSFVASEFLDDATTNQIVECTRVHLRQLDLSATSSTDLFELLEIDAELAKSRIEWSQLSFKRLLGSGQFGDVCHMSLRTGSDADGTKRKRDVAVKSLRPSGCIVSLNDLRCEIAVLAKLAEACNTIVGFVGWGIVDSRSHSRPASFSADTSGMDGSVGGRTLFLVEELCAGGSLAKMVALQSVGEQLYSGTDAIAWALDIARALQCLHDRPEGPIIHRCVSAYASLLEPRPSRPRHPRATVTCAHINPPPPPPPPPPGATGRGGEGSAHARADRAPPPLPSRHPTGT